MCVRAHSAAVPSGFTRALQTCSLERHRAKGLGFRVYAIHSTLPRVCGFGSQAEGLRLRSGLGDGGEEGDLISVHQ